jgi:Lrp/AsnC family leucine-responsive transcriptional regulator
MVIMNNNVEVQKFIKNVTGRSKFIISKNSRALRISRQTYQNKLDDLREKKIITNFTININPIIRPNNLKYVLIEIKTNPKEPELVERLLEIPHLRMLDGIFGEFSLAALFIFKSPEEYHQILNTIDNLMAKSYFKKYQIIETIKVFKTNGISLSNLNMSFVVGRNINLKDIAQNNANIKYNPERFPALVMEIEKFNVTILIFANGKIDIIGLNEFAEIELIIETIISNLNKIGIKIEKKTLEQNYKIDEIDSKILSFLRDSQGFKPISTYDMKTIFKEELKMDISQSTIHNRIKSLEQRGIILNYTINFNPRMIGFEGKYILRIKPKDPSKYNELALRLEANKNITDLYRIGEQYGLLAMVRVRKVEDYGNFIRKLYLTEEIEDTLTNFVLDELKSYTNFVIS